MKPSNRGTGASENEIEVVRHARARRAKLSFDPASGRARLTLPLRAALKPALTWAQGQQDWLAIQRERLPTARPFVDGAQVPIGDETLTLVCHCDGPRSARREGDTLVAGGDEAAFARRIATWLKSEALAVLSVETAEYAAAAGVKVTQVAVGDPRGRWGSCAAHGAIRYSWRLILAPAAVRRATVAHEVAHRVHMDHSAAFHALVADLYGRDPAPERRWLRAHGAALHWIGRSASR